MQSVYLFHGFIAVAPLKLGESLAEQEQSGLFHGFIAVAPLKLDGVGDRVHGTLSSTASSPWPH